MLNRSWILAVGATLLAALGAACTTDETTTGSGPTKSPARPMVLQVSETSLIGIEPKPPFETTPITPMETVGASRLE